MDSLKVGQEVWCDNCTIPVIATYGDETQFTVVCPECNTGFYLETL